MKSKLTHIAHRLQRIVATSRMTNASPRYLSREVATRLPGPLRAKELVGDYSFQGIDITMHHGTEDHSILSEVFFEREYDPPRDVKAVLPATGLRVLDIGGNVGWFALYVALNMPDDTSLMGIEADAENHERYARQLKNIGRRWDSMHAFAGATSRTVNFTVGQGPFGSSVDDGPSQAVQSVDVLPLLPDFDLVKMDIEGGEWEILGDPRFKESAPTALVLEYHPYLCPSSDARQEARRILEGAGMSIIPVMHNDEKGYGVMWGYKDAASNA